MWAGLQSMLEFWRHLGLRQLSHLQHQPRRTALLPMRLPVRLLRHQLSIHDHNNSHYNNHDQLVSSEHNKRARVRWHGPDHVRSLRHQRLLQHEVLSRPKTGVCVSVLSRFVQQVSTAVHWHAAELCGVGFVEAVRLSSQHQPAAVSQVV
jgi:hypothetical protein